MNRERFQDLVDEAWERIPEGFREHFSNVAIFVEDEPRAEHLQAGGVAPGHTLLGLYQGIPLDKRGWGYSMVLPDQVTLFQGPIERAARSPREVPRIVYETLWHELGHHLGMDEDEVRAAERRRGVRDP
jgi:predicted Zn-dependent protease with MMP-like domain